MKTLLFGGARLDSIAGDFGLLVLRLFAGLSLALAHGLSKIPPNAQFMSGVERLGLPAETAYLSALAEFGGGLALAAGLLTRPAALMMVGNFSVAGFMQHANDPYQVKELPLLFLAVSVMFMFVGGGRFSADRLLR